jgi:hypothetical protein
LAEFDIDASIPFKNFHQPDHAGVLGRNPPGWLAQAILTGISAVTMVADPAATEIY